MRKWHAWAGLKPADKPLSAPYFRDAVVTAPDRASAEAEARRALGITAGDQHLGDVDVQVTDLVPLPEVGETVLVRHARTDDEEPASFDPPVPLVVSGFNRGRPDAHTGFYVPNPAGRGDLYVIAGERYYDIPGQG